ncbi:MAG: GTPase [Isosphaeraceae bacterium]|nr:GTPase [Isosphaeraceae bacterium]
MNRLDLHDTIVAVASPPGPSARGLVRVTGPDALRVAECLDECASDHRSDIPVVRRVRRPLDGFSATIELDVVINPGIKTYTGGPLVELHTVGSPVVLRAILDRCLELGARPAEPGEFTLRAFLSGRIDLTRAEAVLGVIDAHSPEQLSAALEQLAGGIARPIERLRDDLLDRLSHLEAGLDFEEEPDVALLARTDLAEICEAALAALAATIERCSAREVAIGRPRVVLLGDPNAGKSRLFNALIGDDRSIVSATAGTTRDYVAATLQWHGLILELVDTAGIDAADDEISRRAQDFREVASKSADLILLCLAPDSSLPTAWNSGDPRVLAVATKTDLEADAHAHVQIPMRTSAVLAWGIEELRASIVDRLRRVASETDPLAATSARCGDALRNASVALSSAAESIREGYGDEFVALDLRRAIDELGRVVGSIVTDDILDRIFSRFCIGK